MATSVDAVWEQMVPYYRKMGFARVNYTYTRFLTVKPVMVIRTMRCF